MKTFLNHIFFNSHEIQYKYLILANKLYLSLIDGISMVRANAAPAWNRSPNERFLLPNLCGSVAEGGLSLRRHVVHCRPKVGLAFPERPNLCGRLMEDLGIRCMCESRPKRSGRFAWACAGFAKSGCRRRMVGEFILPLLVGAMLSTASSISRLRGRSLLYRDVDIQGDYCGVCVYLLYPVCVRWTCCSLCTLMHKKNILNKNTPLFWQAVKLSVQSLVGEIRTRQSVSVSISLYVHYSEYLF